MWAPIPASRRPPTDVGAVLGRTLRALHELPIAECPFDGRLARCSVAPPLKRQVGGEGSPGGLRSRARWPHARRSPEPQADVVGRIQGLATPDHHQQPVLGLEQPDLVGVGAVDSGPPGGSMPLGLVDEPGGCATVRPALPAYAEVAGLRADRERVAPPTSTR